MYPHIDATLFHAEHRVRVAEVEKYGHHRAELAIELRRRRRARSSAWFRRRAGAAGAPQRGTSTAAARSAGGVLHRQLAYESMSRGR